MLRLPDGGGAGAAPRWCDMPFGVRLLLRPLDLAADMAAENLARHLAEERRGALAAAGEADPFAEGPAALGPSYGFKAAALAELLIAGWEGVGDAEGAGPAELTPAAARALVLGVPKVGYAFMDEIARPLKALEAEGNGSRPSPGTTSPPAGPTATAAASSPAGPAPGARTSATPPSPPTASPPGAPAAGAWR